MDKLTRWEPIETAPKTGTPIWLSREAEDGQYLMYWNGNQWQGWRPGVMGWIATFWDPEAAPPTRWRRVEVSNA